MRTKHIFWGVLFISLGSLLLLSSIFGFVVEIGFILKLWPIVLVLLGVSYLVKNDWAKGAIAALSALLITLLLLSAVNKGKGCVIGHKGKANVKITSDDTTNLDRVTSLPMDSTIKYVNLKFDGGAGTYSITGETMNLFTLRSDNKNRKFDVKNTAKDSVANLTLSMSEFTVDDVDEDHSNSVNLSLNKLPIYKIKIGLGAASSNYDLSDLKIEDLKVDVGAASLKLKLPQPFTNQMNVEINGGASGFDISVPKDAAVQIKVDAALSSTSLPGFTQVSEGVYESAGFATKSKLMKLKISSGVSSINVTQY